MEEHGRRSPMNAVTPPRAIKDIPGIYSVPVLGRLVWPQGVEIRPGEVTSTGDGKVAFHWRPHPRSQENRVTWLRREDVRTVWRFPR